MTLKEVFIYVRVNSLALLTSSYPKPLAW